jgi:decaprenylphospho-beta-D-ribofuranose 2-oxidase
VLRFDPAAGMIEVEPGLSVGELQTVLAGHGWLYPVVPGYPSITVGGCIAFNVHGKGQARDGTFGDWVEALTVWHPAKGVVSCSRTECAELFALTIGGFGLTGVITRAVLRVRPLVGDRVRRRCVAVPHIGEAAEIIRDAGEHMDYAYSWHDLNLRHRRFGAGVVFLEATLPGQTGGLPHGYPDRLMGHRLAFPWRPPDVFVRLMCLGYRWWHQHAPAESELSLHKAMFPIHGLEMYHRQFGPAGFREYQMLIPWARWLEAVEAIEEAIVRTRIAISLGSLKVFRGNTHHLSLAGDGICFSLDVPNNPRSLVLFDAMDEIVLRCGAIPNLSKDSRIGADVVRAAFPGYDAFRAAIHAHDPQRVFASDLSRRIGI